MRLNTPPPSTPQHFSRTHQSLILFPSRLAGYFRSLAHKQSLYLVFSSIWHGEEFCVTQKHAHCSLNTSVSKDAVSTTFVGTTRLSRPRLQFYISGSNSPPPMNTMLLHVLGGNLSSAKRSIKPLLIRGTNFSSLIFLRHFSSGGGWKIPAIAEMCPLRLLLSQLACEQDFHRRLKSQQLQPWRHVPVETCDFLPACRKCGSCCYMKWTFYSLVSTSPQPQGPLINSNFYWL